MLAWLSFWFVKRWNDRTLQRHCHYLGLPVSIAACVWSGLEPLAGCICLAGYASLYLAGTWVFGTPWLTYLGVAAVSGSAYFGSTLVHGVTLADQALLAALLGCAAWVARSGLGRYRVPEPYLVPWRRPAALALATVAMTAATLDLAGTRIGSLSSCGASSPGLVAGGDREPRIAPGTLGLAGFGELPRVDDRCDHACQGGRGAACSQYGLLFAADALAVLVVLEFMGIVRRRTWDAGSVAADHPGLGTFRAAIPKFAVVLIALADLFCLVDLDRGWLSGIVFLMNAIAFLWLTRMSQERALVYLGLAQVVAGVLDLAYWGDRPNSSGFVVASLSFVAASLRAIALAGRCGGVRAGMSSFYGEPCLHVSALLTAVAAVGVFDARYLGLGGYRLGVAASGARPCVGLAVANLAKSRAHLRGRLSSRGGDLHCALQRIRERPEHGLCARARGGDRGALALDARDTVPAGRRSLDGLVFPAALPLGRVHDGAGRFVSLITHR